MSFAQAIASGFSNYVNFSTRAVRSEYWYWVLFSIVFLLCSSWTLLDNEHIRIDIVNNLLPKWLRNAIEVVGHTFFLLPLALIMVVTGIPFFLRSYEIGEQSGNAGGLPQWPSKSLIMIGFAMLLAQGVSERCSDQIGGEGNPFRPACGTVS